MEHYCDECGELVSEYCQTHPEAMVLSIEPVRRIEATAVHKSEHVSGGYDVSIRINGVAGEVTLIMADGLPRAWGNEPGHWVDQWTLSELNKLDQDEFQVALCDIENAASEAIYKYLAEDDDAWTEPEPDDDCLANCYQPAAHAEVVNAAALHGDLGCLAEDGDGWED